MTEQQAHLAGILAHPADDLRRLVYADWLDERDGMVAEPCRNGCRKLRNAHGFDASLCGLCFGTGDGTGRVSNGFAERAEFIEVQLALAKRAGETCVACDDGAECRCDLWHLRRRERELFNFQYATGQRADFHRLALPDEPHLSDDRHSVIAVVRRGFVSEVRCRLADWCGGECERCSGSGVVEGMDSARACMNCSVSSYDDEGTGRTPGIGPRVVAAHPVETVVLADAILPARRTERLPGPVERLPARRVYAVREDTAGPLWPLLDPHGQYPDGLCWNRETDALAAVSAVALAWAKQPTRFAP